MKKLKQLYQIPMIKTLIIIFAIIICFYIGIKIADFVLPLLGFEKL
ncbi:hypothetical protein [Enterococcus faecalis]|nr:hypothetical protein [Enterococcus faecalis]